MPDITPQREEEGLVEVINNTLKGMFMNVAKGANTPNGENIPYAITVILLEHITVLKSLITTPPHYLPPDRFVRLMLKLVSIEEVAKHAIKKRGHMTYEEYEATLNTLRGLKWLDIQVEFKKGDYYREKFEKDGR